MSGASVPEAPGAPEASGEAQCAGTATAGNGPWRVAAQPADSAAAQASVQSREVGNRIIVS
ncbi:hypothetical protein [Burkholderia singularis]|uniref:hypothetical protein n=1 Tax=Burkholderia singularis TaxID=1503053 RepID=UPI001180618A|nr:hypothetical protein [Burkholderia singularis]